MHSWLISVIDFIGWLQGLGGLTKFSVSLISGIDKVRQYLYCPWIQCNNVSLLSHSDPTCLYMFQQPQAVNVLMWARAERQGAYCHPIWLWRIWVLMIEWHVLRIPACVILFLYTYCLGMYTVFKCWVGPSTAGLQFLTHERFLPFSIVGAQLAL